MADRKRYVFRPATGLVRWLQFALLFSFAADLFAAAAMLAQGATGPLVVMSGLVVLLAYVCTLPVVFWVHRVSVNAHSFKPRMNHTVAAALFWYIVPLANLGMPYVAMAEIWSVSGGAKSKNPSMGEMLPVRLWWGLLVSYSMLSTYSKVFASLNLAIIDCLVGAMLALASLWLVTRLYGLQISREKMRAFEDEPEVEVLQAQTIGAGGVA
jgi:hypothetical protein